MYILVKVKRKQQVKLNISQHVPYFEPAREYLATWIGYLVVCLIRQCIYVKLAVAVPYPVG